MSTTILAEEMYVKKSDLLLYIKMLYVKKRDGSMEEVMFDKVTNRIKFLCNGVLRDGTKIGEPLTICYLDVAKNVISSITDGITTRELDEYAAKYCAEHVVDDYQYAVLGGRITVSNHHKNTLSSFYDTMKLLYENCDEQGNPCPLVTRSFLKVVMKNSAALEAMIDYKRDYAINYFGYMSSENCYLKRRVGVTVTERLQHVYLRMAVHFHGDDMVGVKDTYDMLSMGLVSHASPTMYYSGTPCGNLASCYLLGLKDSIDEDNGIPDCWGSCTRISKQAGGIGVGITPVRATGSIIRSVNGPSDGLVPLMGVFNAIARYANQGGRRKGAFAIYLEPWHPDIMAFLDLKKNHGKEELRARDLFYGLWVPDIFMRRVKLALEENRPVRWTLMCPDACHRNEDPRLYDVHGAEFDRIYEKYEAAGMGVAVPDIRTIWFAYLKSLKETGGPYMLYKDSVNLKNNQSNLGTIRNSNLCAEIVEYSNDREHAVCTLASLVLHKFVIQTESGPQYDFQKLFQTARKTLINLDRIIDLNVYPTIETKRSNLSHRPVGLGVQGLADTFFMFRYPFDSEDALKLNRKIFETIYFGCMTASMELARSRQRDMEELKEKYGDTLTFTDEFTPSRKLPISVIEKEYNRSSHIGSYSSFVGSPLSTGLFQFDMWPDERPDPELNWDWSTLREEIMKYGVRNSLTTAIMPTASTASILNNTECIEPVKFNIYTRRVSSGEFILSNQYLQSDLMKRGLWTSDVKRKLIANRGSIQDISEIPPDIKLLYRTAFELKQKCIIDLARSRGPFVDQTQSMNGFFKDPSDRILTSFLMYGWECGLKTGLYYCRRLPKLEPIQFTVDTAVSVNTSETPETPENETECVSCSA